MLIQLNWFSNADNCNMSINSNVQLQPEVVFLQNFNWCKIKWKKVGEGLCDEVFKYSSGNQCTIVKIILIKDQLNINNDQQKSMFEVYNEIVIAMELNKLWKKRDLN